MNKSQNANQFCKMATANQFYKSQIVFPNKLSNNSLLTLPKQRHCFTQNKMTRTKSQIKLINQVLLSAHNTKFTTLHLFPCTSEDYKNISNMIRD